LCGSEPGKNWSTGFKARHKDILDSRYLNAIDLARHKADSKASYEQYFTIPRQNGPVQHTTSQLLQYG
jgi:hypothetical protein